MRLPFRRFGTRWWMDLDKVTARLTEIDPNDSQSVQEYARELIVYLANGECQALHLFYHEENDCVRPCLWTATDRNDLRAGWHQMLPLGSAPGLRLLRDIRHAVRRRICSGTHITGTIYYRQGRRRHELLLESPHDWDIRLYTGDQRPDKPPFTLVYAGV